MNTRLRRKGIFTAAGTLLGMGLLLVACPSALVPYSYHYQYSSVDDEYHAAPLFLTKHLVGVRFDDALSEDERAALISSIPVLRPYEDRFGDFDRVDMSVLKLRFWATQDVTLETIEQLKATEGITLATPVVHGESGPAYSYLISDQFDVVFESTATEEDIAELNAEHAVEIVSVRSPEHLWYSIYTLRVTDASGMGAIDMANLYHLETHVRNATPHLTALYSVLASNIEE